MRRAHLLPLLALALVPGTAFANHDRPGPHDDWRAMPTPGAYDDRDYDRRDYDRGDWERQRDDWLADCRRRTRSGNGGRIGAAAGAVVGGVVGAAIGGVAGNLIAGRGDKLGGTLIGAGVGGLAGLAVGEAANRDRGRRADYCEDMLERAWAQGSHDQRGYGHGYPPQGHGAPHGYPAHAMGYAPMMMPVMYVPMPVAPAHHAKPKCTETVTYEYVTVPARRSVRYVPAKRVRYVSDKRVRIGKRVPAS